MGSVHRLDAIALAIAPCVRAVQADEAAASDMAWTKSQRACWS
jgi:hypothetical protein